MGDLKEGFVLEYPKNTKLLDLNKSDRKGFLIFLVPLSNLNLDMKRIIFGL
jgi:hypothetical protein